MGEGFNFVTEINIFIARFLSITFKKIRCEMVNDIKGNFKDKYRKKGGDEALKCDDCNQTKFRHKATVWYVHTWRT